MTQKKTKLNVIVIDDSPLTHLVVEKAIETIDFAVLSAHCYNGEEFIDLVHNTKPDIAFIDIEMTGIDGFTALQTARKHYPELKSIFLSQYISNGFVKAAKNIGANGFLTKMPTVETIKDALIKVINGEFALDKSIEMD